MDAEESSDGSSPEAPRRRRSANRGSAGAAVACAAEPEFEVRAEPRPEARFLEDVLAGMRQRPPEIPSKYLYDETGSRLFDAICELDVYYPTRTELAILEKCAGEIADRVGSGCLLIEFGSGSSVKTRVLLNHLDRPAGYVPIDISREHLRRSAIALSRSYPGLPVLPVCGDYTRLDDVPEPLAASRRRMLFFPGSTIGNLEPAEAEALLGRMARIVGRGGLLLIGVDLDKDEQMLELAYDDPEGVTAAFELNVLQRINRELGGNFDLGQWSYRARYRARCVEMSVVSRRRQPVRIGGVAFQFAAGAHIVTERSHKYTVEGFRALARRADLDPCALWTDPDELFSVQFFSVP